MNKKLIIKYRQLSLLRKLYKDEDGDGLIDAIIVNPLWLLMLFSFFSFFMLMVGYGTIMNAVNLGLERAATIGGVDASVINIVQSELKHSGIPLGNFTISGTPYPVSYGGDITLTVSAPKPVIEFPTQRELTLSVSHTIMSQAP